MTQRRLPNGDNTSDIEAWGAAWDEFNNRLEALLNIKVMAFEPGIQVANENFQSHVVIPMWLAQRVVALKAPAKSAVADQIFNEPAAALAALDQMRDHEKIYVNWHEDGGAVIYCLSGVYHLYSVPLYGGEESYVDTSSETPAAKKRIIDAAFSWT